jgi:hypothetical protein
MRGTRASAVFPGFLRGRGSFGPSSELATGRLARIVGGGDGLKALAPEGGVGFRGRSARL